MTNFALYFTLPKISTFHLSFTVLVRYWLSILYSVFGALYLRKLTSISKDIYSIPMEKGRSSVTLEIATTGLSPSVVFEKYGILIGRSSLPEWRRSWAESSRGRPVHFVVCLRSPLLTKSLLFSFPSLNNMLKFSEWSYDTGV